MWFTRCMSSARHAKPELDAPAPTLPTAATRVGGFVPTERYAADAISPRSAILGLISAAVGAFTITLVAWFILKSTSLPAFSTSMVTRALSTVGIVVTVLLTGGLLGVWIMDEYRARGRQDYARPQWRTALTYAVAYLSPAVLVISALGIPLSATNLWLDGIQVDQVFRTQFLTRMTAEGGWADMNYVGLPTFYPMGWFWLGGQFAKILHLPGWAVFQPWALVSLAVAGSILVPVWQRLVGSLPVATAIALMTVAVSLTMGAEEPYSTIISMGAPAAAIMCARAFNGSWMSTVGLLLFLGISATFYTLYTGAIALTVVTLVGIATAAYERRLLPLVRLLIIGLGSMAVAAVAWGPYLRRALTADVPLESAAQHYLPSEGTLIPVPFLAPSVIGVLCFIGLVYLVMRIADPDVRTLVWALVGFYLWCVASMVMTLAGTTLLGFRLEPLVVLTLATAGVLGLAEIRLMGVHRLYPQILDVPTNRAITWVFIIVLGLAGIHYAQNIPEANEHALDNSYQDTDGYGERADRFTPDSASNYPKIDEVIRAHGYTPQDTVVLTDEKLFLAYHPYHGFNAFTSHYANPLGEFSRRNDLIDTWAAHSRAMSPQDFKAALDASPWPAPDAILFRGDVSNPGDGFKLHLAEDIYPNQPNVRYRAVFFNPDVFKEGWMVHQVGPYVVAVRDRG